MQKYHVKLSEEERKRIEGYIRSKKHSMESKKRAYVLLDVDESNGKELPALKSIVLSVDKAGIITRWHIV